MKNKIWIVLAVALTAVIAAAAILYPKLSDKYSPETTIAEPKSSSDIIQTDDFTVYDSDMNKVKLSDYFGRPIVVNFWASWCGPCKSELPAFNDAYEKYKDDVVFLMVNLPDGYSDSQKSIEKFISENGYKFPVYYDFENNASTVYGVNSIPETLFINADGTLYDTQIGAMSAETLENYIQQIKGEAK